MISSSVLTVFVPTFLLVSVTPGMCMTLALTLGISIGIRRTLWMILGELTGVGIVAIAAVTSVASIMLLHPQAFTALKIIGGCYILFLGGQLWLSRGKISLNLDLQQSSPPSAKSLAFQGFITAIANPKGWAFFIALLPPFIDQNQALTPQLSVLLAIMLSLEFICLLIYALGGKALRTLLLKDGNVILLNRLTGVLMMAVGVWLIGS